KCPLRMQQYLLYPQRLNLEAAAILNQFPDGDSAQSPLLAFAVSLELLDDLAHVLLVPGGWRNQHGHGLPALGDKDLLSPSCPLQKLGQVGFCLERTKFRHGPS